MVGSTLHDSEECLTYFLKTPFAIRIRIHAKSGIESVDEFPNLKACASFLLSFFMLLTANYRRGWPAGLKGLPSKQVLPFFRPALVLVPML